MSFPADVNEAPQLASPSQFLMNENTLPFNNTPVGAYNKTPVGFLAYTVVPFDYDTWQTHTMLIVSGNFMNAFAVRSRLNDD